MENINNEKESLNLFSVAEIFYKNKIKIVFFASRIYGCLNLQFYNEGSLFIEALIMSSESSQSNSLLDRYSSLAG